MNPPPGPEDPSGPEDGGVRPRVAPGAGPDGDPFAEELPSPDQQYAVLVVDPQTGEVDVHGPFDGPGAVVDAARRREEHDRADLEDVLIQVARLQSPGDLPRRA